MADKTKYNFNGKKNLGKRNLAEEIIKKYLLDNLNKTYNELKSTFNFQASNRHTIFYNQKDFDNWKNRQTNKTERYFKPINYNNEKIHICNQWSVDSIKPLLDLAKNEFKYDIEIILDNIDNKKTILNSKHVKNIILYGTPGVGKTHNYQNLISMIEDGKSQKEIFDAVTDNTTDKKVELDKEAFQKLKDEKRVEFVTFHQSYSYEDFIEGFRPNEDNGIKLEDGIFKTIAYEAKKNLEDSKKEVDTINEEKKFEELFELFKDKIQDDIDKNKKFDINETVYITNIEEDAFRYTGDNWGNTQRMKYTDIKLLHKFNIKERKDVKKQDNISGLAKQHATYFSYFMKKLFAFKEQQNINIENIRKIEQKNFYIVIDEINRGNISKIFGELITLIEEDKRDIYEVTLPYSKEPFKVPSNLYIIATMNSTDKSIATVDIALRRRFTFLKMKPNLELVTDVDANELMKKLNIFIKENLGEDYMLGHSYFMGEDIDLKFIAKYKIEPLLEEYFYADDDKLPKVLAMLPKENN